MAGIIDIAATAIGQSLAAVAGETITATRGGQTIELPAVIGASAIETVAGDTIEQSQSVDFIVSAVDYDFGGGPVEPERGDRFARTIGESTLVYEAMSMLGAAVFRYCDSSRLRLRIHSKRVT
jgi:hypothetical protein